MDLNEEDKKKKEIEDKDFVILNDIHFILAMLKEGLVDIKTDDGKSKVVYAINKALKLFSELSDPDKINKLQIDDMFLMLTIKATSMVVIK